MNASGDCWNITAASREATVDIFGVIGDLGFFGESTTAADFIRGMRDVGKGVNRLNINLHSEGGSVWDGMAIYRAIRDFPGEKVVNVSALAASIASVIMLAGDKINVAPEAVVMIHDPMAIVAGNERDMADAISRLQRAKNGILDVYARRTGANRDKLSEMMTAETWFQGGEEIKAAGFADNILKDAPASRIAACALTLTNHWKHPPEAVVNRKPAPLKPDVAARLEKLRDKDHASLSRSRV